MGKVSLGSLLILAIFAFAYFKHALNMYYAHEITMLVFWLAMVWVVSTIYFFKECKERRTKKVLTVVLTIFICMAFAFSANASHELIEKAFTLHTLPDSTQILYHYGKPFKGTRIQMLAMVKTILGQPDQKQLMLLNQNGTGVFAGTADDRLLLMQDPKTKIWKLVAESYKLGAMIVGASVPTNDSHGVDVYLQKTMPDTVGVVSLREPHWR